MHDDLTDRIRKMGVALKDLESKQKDLNKELVQMDQKNRSLIQENDRLSEKVRQLNEQVLLLKSSLAPLGEKDKKQFEKRINEYLKTIEKSISLLQS